MTTEITTAAELLTLLKGIEGHVTIKEGVLWTEAGQSVDLSKIDDGAKLEQLSAEFKMAHDLFEDRFAKLNADLANGDLSGAQFPRVGAEAAIELTTRQSQMQWVLEMLPNPARFQPTVPAIEGSTL